MTKAMLLLSGGPDSATLAYWLSNEGFVLNTLTFEFGEHEGKANEIAAEKVASNLGAKHRHVTLYPALRQLYQTDGPIHTLRNPDEEANIMSFGAGYALSLAVSAAQEAGISRLYYAVHVEDAKFRENCSEFFESLSRAAAIYWGKPFEICTPFLKMTKSEVIALGNTLGVPWSDTWSCTASSDAHCGSCVSCKARQSAFDSTGTIDPTTYGEA